jgi:hypothetical protein
VEELVELALDKIDLMELMLLRIALPPETEQRAAGIRWGAGILGKF